MLLSVILPVVPQSLGKGSDQSSSDLPDVHMLGSTKRSYMCTFKASLWLAYSRPAHPELLSCASARLVTLHRRYDTTAKYILFDDKHHLSFCFFIRRVWLADVSVSPRFQIVQ